MEPEPSVGRLAGQLDYLFEDEPALRRAPPEQLLDRLNHDDRFARARATYPLESDDEIRERVGEFEARIALGTLEAALAELGRRSER
jgi:hypothetical protein